MLFALSLLHPGVSSRFASSQSRLLMSILRSQLPTRLSSPKIALESRALAAQCHLMASRQSTSCSVFLLLERRCSNIRYPSSHDPILGWLTEVVKTGTSMHSAIHTFMQTAKRPPRFRGNFSRERGNFIGAASLS